MSDHPHAAAAHPHPNYVKIWAILCMLLVVSVTGPMLHIRVVTLVAAFGIAVVKAYMVAKNFMHLDIEKPIIRWALATVVALMVLLYAGLAPDVQKSSGQHWVKSEGFHYMSEAARGAHEGGEHGREPEHK